MSVGEYGGMMLRRRWRGCMKKSQSAVRDEAPLPPRGKAYPADGGVCGGVRRGVTRMKKEWCSLLRGKLSTPRHAYSSSHPISFPPFSA